MVKKYCRECCKVSYSLSADGLWICPHCAADITDQPAARPAPWAAGILPIICSTPEDASSFN